MQEWTIVGKDMISEVSSKETYAWKHEWQEGVGSGGEGLDGGNARRRVLRFRTSATAAAAGDSCTPPPFRGYPRRRRVMNPDGVLFRNGSGAPSAVRTR